MKVGIIIPCYNEEKRLNVETFRRCLTDFNEIQICFVNDGSNDGTLNILNKLKNEFFQRVTIINKKKNQGKSMAIKAGARYFYSISEIQYVGYIHADFNSNYGDFEGLIKELKHNRKLEMYFGNKMEILNKITKNITSLIKLNLSSRIIFRILFIFK
ncbi:glycosyltransferase [Tenacibaculum sp. C7A-26P2]|uniref:glycosyltransferase n=1 Tax=Tenacibaculum sp. C7A-26P2 TaxID=3447504 RepID=UPI003F87B05B